MDLPPIYKRVIGLDVHQAKISACTLQSASFESEMGPHFFCSSGFSRGSGVGKHAVRAVALGGPKGTSAYKLCSKYTMC